MFISSFCKKKQKLSGQEKIREISSLRPRKITTRPIFYALLLIYRISNMCFSELGLPLKISTNFFYARVKNKFFFEFCILGFWICLGFRV